ncbi:hypothetical protein [Amycolatopsis arida]|uniref:hypothetical protein n=1 Tax=Amycolatopsis arida TaxID=587909 RepID=UPI000B86C23D|nr:hypothetical protein [Amycolatopsis arida]
MTTAATALPTAGRPAQWTGVADVPLPHGTGYRQRPSVGPSEPGVTWPAVVEVACVGDRPARWSGCRLLAAVGGAPDFPSARPVRGRAEVAGRGQRPASVVGHG